MGKRAKTPHIVSLELVLERDIKVLDALRIERAGEGEIACTLTRANGGGEFRGTGDSADAAVGKALRAAGLGAGQKGAVKSADLRRFVGWLDDGAADAIELEPETLASSEYPGDGLEPDDYGDVWIQIVRIEFDGKKVEGWSDGFSAALGACKYDRNWKAFEKRTGK